MPGPWENYQSQPAEQGPWTKYGAAPPSAPTGDAGEKGMTVAPGKGVAGQVAASSGDAENDTLGREVSSLGKSIAGIPGGLYHSFADDAETPDEKQLIAGHNPALGHVALGGYRMIAKPISTAANWYKDAAEGKIPDPVGQALTVAPEAMGIGAAAPIAEKLGEMAPRAVKTTADNVVPAVTKIAEKVRNVTPKQAAQVAGGATGAVAGHGSLSAPGAYYGAKTFGKVTDAVLGKTRANTPIFQPKPVYPGAPLPEVPSAEVMQASPLRTGSRAIAPPPAAALGKIPAQTVYPGAHLPEHPGTFSGAHLPEAPTPELIKARAIGQGAKAPPPEPSAGLGKLPDPKTEPMIAKPNTSPKAIQSALNDSLGAPKPLQPGVKLRDQGKVPTPAAAPTDLKPVDSTAVKAYKYDPVKREFTAANPDGQTFIHGDVSPEEAKAFDKASSKGKAWKVIKDNHPLVGKIVNGQRVNHIPSIRSASPNE